MKVIRNILKHIRAFFTALAGDKKIFTLEHRILNLFIATIIIAFPFLVLINIMIGLPGLANSPLVIAILFHIFLFFLARVKKIYFFTVIVSITSWLIIIPFLFISCAGFNGGPAYAFTPILLYICVVTSGKIRNIMLSIAGLETVSLYFANFFLPHIFYNYATESGRFIDITASMVLVNTLSCLMLAIVKKEYDRAHEETQAVLEKQIQLSKKNEYFVKVFAHDMKNHLAANILLLNICQNDPQKKFLEEISTGEKNMSLMVNNIINLFSREKIELQKETINVSQLIDTFKTQWGAFFHSKNILFVCEQKNIQYIWADKNYMDLVWNNMFSNILSHAPQKSKVMVKFSKDTNLSVISFLNQGEIIPLPARNDIFTRYFSGEKQTAYHKNLGLNYSKMMCNMHGGDLTYEVENNMNKFTITLPERENNS